MREIERNIETPLVGNISNANISKDLTNPRV